ncbi:hypothetical protein [Bradyrhizobium genosp. A]|uniref:hypothetical protein n=1 Tax=Bradyrhizobium genosp. A TaxID=83626 RepID=UPI003CF22338
MASLFNEETLADIDRKFRTVGTRTDGIVLRYVYHPYKSALAQEFAHHGFVRRVRILERCIRNVFEMIPPSTSNKVSPAIIADAQINIQAFVANIYGCVDNLAWVWAHETGLADRIDRRRIGLRSHNTEVRKSLSQETQAYLTGLDQWFAYVVEYRDALAHRIPLYIPERVRPENIDAYNALTAQIAEALNTLNAIEYETLAALQNELLEFQPFITHSIRETTGQVAFHVQMIADFLTVEELGQKMHSICEGA